MSGTDCCLRVEGGCGATSRSVCVGGCVNSVRVHGNKEKHKFSLEMICSKYYLYVPSKIGNHSYNLGE